MDARQVRYFLAVVDHGGVTRAAEALHIAQPSISQSVRGLERELGVQLFHRVGRGMQLSEAGRTFLEPARRIAADLDTAMASVHRTADLLEGELELAATQDLSIDPLVGLLTVFRSNHPRVRVRVHRAADPEHAARIVRDATCEIAITALPERYAGLTAARLGERALQLVVPHDLELPDGWSHDRATSWDDVARLPLVVGSIGDLTRTLLDERLRAIGKRPRVVAEADAPGAVAALVQAGAGAGLLPAATAERITAAGGAVVCDISTPLVVPVGLLHRRGSLSAASRAFLRITERP